MKYRHILLKMREQRNKELDELNQFLNSSFSFSTEDQIKGMHVGKMASPKEKVLISPVQSFGSLWEKRKTILTLELPFKTDTISINRALVNSFPKNTPTEYEDPNNWAAGYFRTRSLYDGMVQGNHMINLLYNKVWPTTRQVQFDAEGNKSVSLSFTKAHIEDFTSEIVKELFFDEIKSLPIKKSSLKTYLCHARNMLSYCFHQTRTPALPLLGLQAKTLAEYLEYLEYNCLKRRSIESYKNLIGVRLLFYAPPKLKQLQEITLKHIDKVHLVVNFGTMSFPVPSTFVELACALFSKNDPLLQKNTKQLNKFIEKTTKTIGLKRVNPTDLSVEFK